MDTLQHLKVEEVGEVVEFSAHKGWFGRFCMGIDGV
jgi:hypothetical protein